MRKEKPTREPQEKGKAKKKSFILGKRLDASKSGSKQVIFTAGGGRKGCQKEK